MRAEIITIGDELLIGQTVDTNAAWLGQQLSLNGIPIYRCTTISDKKDEIISAVDIAINRSEVVLVTGGLGPTKDDITKYTLCEYFDTELEVNKEVLSEIEDFFKRRNMPMLPVNVQQAALPKDAIKLKNALGTAAGMWFEKNGSVLISMPGVPYEMKGIMTDEVFPRLKKMFEVSEMYHHTLMTQGIGESFLAEELEDWEERVRQKGYGLAYLPSVGSLKLRITSAKGKTDATDINTLFDEVKERLPQHVFGENEISLSEVVGNLLKAKNKTMCTIESCTGGAISKTIVEVSGSSAYYNGSVIAYTNQLKEKLVGVDAQILKDKGAVSEETVVAMAKGGKLLLDSDYAIAISGIAGPNGGTEEKPVGTVWMAIAHPKGVESKQLSLGSSRNRNIQITVLSALNFLRNILLEQY